MRRGTAGTVLALVLCTACTTADGRPVAEPSPSPSPSPGAGTGCAAGPAETATCRFITTWQVQGRDGLFNQELRAALEGPALPAGSWRVETCAAPDPVRATCVMEFEGSSRATFNLLATNAVDGDGRLVLLEGEVPSYAVQSYALS